MIWDRFALDLRCTRLIASLWIVRPFSLHYVAGASRCAGDIPAPLRGLCPVTRHASRGHAARLALRARRLLIFAIEVAVALWSVPPPPLPPRGPARRRSGSAGAPLGETPRCAPAPPPLRLRRPARAPRTSQVPSTGARAPRWQRPGGRHPPARPGVRVFPLCTSRSMRTFRPRSVRVRVVMEKLSTLQMMAPEKVAVSGAPQPTGPGSWACRRVPPGRAKPHPARPAPFPFRDQPPSPPPMLTARASPSTWAAPSAGPIGG